MKLNGTTIKMLIDNAELELESLYQAFANHMTSYDDEKKESPLSFVEQIESVEWARSVMQSVRKQYNATVIAELRDLPLESMTLATAVNLSQSYARLSKTLRQITNYKDSLSSRSAWDKLVMKGDGESRPMLNADRNATIVELKRMKKIQARLREAIGKSNLVDVDFETANIKKAVQILDS